MELRSYWHSQLSVLTYDRTASVFVLFDWLGFEIQLIPQSFDLLFILSSPFLFLHQFHHVHLFLLVHHLLLEYVTRLTTLDGVQLELYLHYGSFQVGLLRSLFFLDFLFIEFEANFPCSEYLLFLMRLVLFLNSFNELIFLLLTTRLCL